MDIPYKQLPDDILTAVIEEFVLREGTEYGMQDIPLADKVAAVREQLKRGQAMVVFDPESETTSIEARR